MTETINSGARVLRPQNELMTALLGAPATMITAGLILCLIGGWSYPMVNGAGLMKTAAIYGAAAAAVYAVIGAAILRRRGAGWGAVALLALLCAIGFPLLAMGGAVTANGAMDDSPENMIGVVITGKQTYSKWGRTHYALDVRSWRAPGATERLDVSGELHDAVTPYSDILLVTTKGGWLWREWIVWVERQPG